MKIVCISLLTPTSENYRGASALSYHISKFRPSDIQLIIYTYNLNNVQEEKIKDIEKELNCKIRFLCKPRWFDLIRFFNFIRIFLLYPYMGYIKLKVDELNEIKKDNPDAVWINGEEAWRIAAQLKDLNYDCVHTFPDCESLYYKRSIELGNVFSSNQQIRNHIMFPKYRRMEKKMRKGVSCHLVGKADAVELLSINNSLNVHFILHPHYDLSKSKKTISFKKRMKVLIAGKNNLYMSHSASQVVDILCKNKNLIDFFDFTFLGYGWEGQACKMKDVGYNVKIIQYAPVYLDEIIKHDIQITPITIGTGTKGKVLDALANGLLVIGSTYSLENIAVVDGESCIQFTSPQKVVDVLLDITVNSNKYEKIAEQGRTEVTTFHKRESVSEAFFNLFRK